MLLALLRFVVPSRFPTLFFPFFPKLTVLAVFFQVCFQLIFWIKTRGLRLWNQFFVFAVYEWEGVVVVTIVVTCCHHCFEVLNVC